MCPYKMETTLLEEVSNSNELQISYRMPAGFKALDKDFVDSIARVEMNYDPFAAQLVALYVDTLLSNANVSISDMRHIPGERTNNQLDFYKTEFNRSQYWTTVSRNDYKLTGFQKIVQLDLANADKHLVKVFFYDNDKAVFCVDYFFAEAYYNDLKPFIESSIVSFSKGYQIIIENK